ncbi:MAG: sulfatase [Thermoleophilia bacterium]|nr:sulfatase [Thermoleophilia bacterium]
MIAINRTFLRVFAAGSLTGAALVGLPGLAQASRPNIVVIQTDDQSPRTAKATYRGKSGRSHLVMPNTVRKIFRGGTEFTNQYATTPVCSPSRASMLTGQYPQNDKLTGNSGAHGGWEGWQNSPGYTQNLPVTLQNAGYRTAHVGKFVNGYYDGENDRVDTTVPPGWDNWFTTAYLPGTRYYGYPVSHNGQALPPFGNANYKSNGPGIDPKSCTAKLLTKLHASRKCNYLTDVMAHEAVEEIRKSKGSPFYLQVDFQGPHGDIKGPEGPQPATRHLGSASRTPLPRPKNFNEADTSDKPALLRDRAPKRMTKKDIGHLRDAYRKQLESLRSVDDGVGAILKTLRRTGELDNTYIFFMSDHGYYLGEHRYADGKFMPYDESATVAMAVRGPGVPSGGHTGEITGNIDIAPTALQLAGATPDYDFDGRSLEPFWKHPKRTTRRPIGIALGLLPHVAPAATSAKAPILNYRGFRVGPYKYVEYEAGGAELYDLKRDPFEMNNRIGSARYSAVRAYMKEHLPDVAACKGSGCRAALPPWPEPAA